MVEYLKKLVEDGDYHKALNYADRLLLNDGNSPDDLLTIQYMILQARLATNEFYGALIAGQLTVKLAEEQCNWEIYSSACISLAVVYGRTRQYDLALNVLYSCLSTIATKYSNRQVETLAWYNIGVAYRSMGNSDESAKALNIGLEVASQAGLTRTAHGMRHAMIEAYLQSETYEPIPGLLAKCLHYIRHNPSEVYIQESYRWHIQLRAEFALRTTRYGRAIAVIERGLRVCRGNAHHMFFFLKLRARVAYQMGASAEALGYILAARAKAIECRRYDLESEAAEFMYYLAKDNPGSIQRIDSSLVLDSLNLRLSPLDPYPN